MNKTRTILMQLVNEEVLDCLTIIGETEEKISLEDRIIYDIGEQFDIKSTQEYLDKFHPTIYQYLDTERYYVLTSDKRQQNMQAEERQMVLHKENWLVRFLEDVLLKREHRQNHIEPFKMVWGYCFDTDRLLELEYIRIQWKKLWLEKREQKKEVEEDVLSYEESKQWEKYLNEQIRKLDFRNPSLMVRCLTGTTDYGMDSQEAIEEYNQYAEFFGDVVENFWKTALPMIELFLQVHYFFAEKKEGMEKVLMVANCKPEKMMLPDYRRRLGVYLETVNEKTSSREMIV